MNWGYTTILAIASIPMLALGLNALGILPDKIAVKLFNKWLGLVSITSFCFAISVAFGWISITDQEGINRNKFESSSIEIRNINQKNQTKTFDLKGLESQDLNRITQEVEAHMDMKMDGKYLTHSEFITWGLAALFTFIVGVATMVFNRR